MYPMLLISFDVCDNYPCFFPHPLIHFYILSVPAAICFTMWSMQHQEKTYKVVLVKTQIKMTRKKSKCVLVIDCPLSLAVNNHTCTEGMKEV